MSKELDRLKELTPGYEVYICIPLVPYVEPVKEETPNNNKKKFLIEFKTVIEIVAKSNCADDELKALAYDVYQDHNWSDPKMKIIDVGPSLTKKELEELGEWEEEQ